MPNFNNIFLSVDTCIGFSQSGKECKPREEIRKFVQENIFYVKIQETKVDQHIFEETADDSFSDKGDPSQYYPLLKDHKTPFYQNIEFQNTGVTPWLELMLGID